MRWILAAALLYPAFAAAQAPELQMHQRAVIQRDQQSESFALQLRQSQRELRSAPGLSGVNPLQERQDFDNLAERQLREARPESPTPAPRIGERERFAQERTLVLPPPVIRGIVRPAGHSGSELHQSLTVTQ